MFTKFAISEALTQRLWFLTIASPRREAGADPGSREPEWARVWPRNNSD
jgi:hypothetical protein